MPPAGRRPPAAATPADRRPRLTAPFFLVPRSTRRKHIRPPDSEFLNSSRPAPFRAPLSPPNPCSSQGKLPTIEGSASPGSRLRHKVGRTQRLGSSRGTPRWPVLREPGGHPSGPGFLLDTPQCPSEPRQRDNLLPSIFTQDIAHNEEGASAQPMPRLSFAGRFWVSPGDFEGHSSPNSFR